MHYDLTDLRLFAHVGDCLSLTRAAEKSFMSLPSASLRIKQLEESFQTPLLNRLSKGLTLTPAGDALLRHARHVLRQLDMLHADLLPYAKGVKGRIRMLANSTATNTFLSDALSAFLKDNPDVDIDLEELPSREITAMLARGAADLGIVAATDQAAELDVLHLFHDELMVIAHPADPVCKQPTLCLSDMLDDCRFVGLNQQNSIQVFLDRKAHASGKRINLRIQVGSYDAVCRMVEAGAGVAIVPRICAEAYSRHERLRLIALGDDWARREISLVRQHGRLLPAFAQALIQHLLDAASMRKAEAAATLSAPA